MVMRGLISSLLHAPRTHSLSRDYDECFVSSDTRPARRHASNILIHGDDNDDGTHQVNHLQFVAG